MEQVHRDSFSAKWNPKIFSIRFRECLMSLSVQEAVMLTGLAVYTIQSMRKNPSTRPGLRTVAVIAHRCGVSLDWMFGLSDKKEIS